MAGTTTIDMLEAGTYNVTITDDNGCMTTCTFTITDPACALSLDIVGTNLNCAGDDSGAIELTVSGAVGNVTFDWNVDALDGTEDPSGLAAGTYQVTVTDEAGCTASTSVTLTEPAALMLSCAEDQPVSTVGGNDGSAALTISGGTAPFAIDYTGPVNGSATANMAGTITIDMLEAGIYNVTITDDNGCITTCTFVITAPGCTLELQAEVTDVQCPNSSDGNIALTVTGATGAVTYDWNIDNFDGFDNANGLNAGLYMVTVTDEAGCVAILEETIEAPPPFDVLFLTVDPACFGDVEGQLIIDTISGGTPGYELSVDGEFFQPAGSFPITISNLAAGSYELVLQDEIDCAVAIPFDIVEPQELTLDLGGDEEIELGDSLQLMPEANFTIDSFIWDNQALLDNPLDLMPFTTPFVTTLFTLTAYDAAGCEVSSSKLVFIDTSLDIFVPNIFSPNDDGFNDYFTLYAGADVAEIEKLIVFDRWGNALFERDEFLPNVDILGWDGNFRGKPMNTGVYVFYAEVRLIDGSTEIVKGDVTLMR
jgi:gliding motility-associated-like protein